MTTPATKKPAARSGTREPGPKPRYAVVEHSFHARLNDGGDVVLDLRLPFDNLIALTKMEESDDEQANMRLIGYLVDEVLTEEVHAKLQSLQDGTEAFQLLMAYVEAIGKRLGASLGESGRSSGS